MIIKVIDNFKKEFEKDKKVLRAIEQGKYVKPQPKTLYFTPKTFHSTFTPERIKLIQMLRDKNNLSISEIARKIGRPFGSVHRDIRFLEGFGLINLKHKQKYRIPTAIKKVTFNI